MKRTGTLTFLLLFFTLLPAAAVFILLLLLGRRGMFAALLLLAGSCGLALLAARRWARRLDLLNSLAQLDSLTRLYNRGMLERLVGARLNLSHKKKHAFILIDLDHFKQVNDSFGHIRGDELLRHTAQTLAGFCGEQDLAGRVGGDEFVLYLEDAAHPEQLTKTLDGIFSAFSGQADGCTISAGAACYPAHGKTYFDLFRQADLALYRAKRAGKACYRVCGDDVKSAQSLKNR